MERFSLLHEFDCDLEAFEKAIADLELDAYVSKHLSSIEKRETIEMKEVDGVLIRKIRTIPVDKVPAAAKRIVKPEYTYWVEETRWRREARTIDFFIIHEFFKNKFDSRGQYQWWPEGSKVKRRIDFELTVKMFGVGGLVERWIVPQVRSSLEEESSILKQFIRERQAKGR